MHKSYKYVIVGAGLAGASAVEGIREIDREGSVLIIGAERHLPYNRPPLSKKLWQGKSQVEDIFVHDAAFYASSGVNVALETRVTQIDTSAKTLTAADGNVYEYDRLLLATGGSPNKLSIPGGDLPEIYYYRYLDDYLAANAATPPASSALVIGGGFIGTELAAALQINKVQVTMLFPDHHFCSRALPQSLALSIQKDYEARGITVLSEELPVSIEKQDDKYVTRTSKGKSVESDLVFAGIGLKPSIELAANAGLETGNGIVVDEFLRTSDPNVFAAGDNANFPYIALDKRVRVEHWDNALNQGKFAGRNMADAEEKYDYMPYFFSDMFDFGYEAVGDVDASLDLYEDWQKPFETGVVYFLRDKRVRGVMMCNVWDKVDAARELIRSGNIIDRSEDLAGTIA